MTNLINFTDTVIEILPLCIVLFLVVSLFSFAFGQVAFWAGIIVSVLAVSFLIITAVPTY